MLLLLVVYVFWNDLHQNVFSFILLAELQYYNNEISASNPSNKPIVKILTYNQQCFTNLGDLIQEHCQNIFYYYKKLGNRNAVYT